MKEGILIQNYPKNHKINTLIDRLPLYFEDTVKYLVVKLPDRIYRNEKIETWHVVDKWLGKDQFAGIELPVFCRTGENLTDIEKMRKIAWRKINNFEYPCKKLN